MSSSYYVLRPAGSRQTTPQYPASPCPARYPPTTPPGTSRGSPHSFNTVINNHDYHCEIHSLTILPYAVSLSPETRDKQCELETYQFLSIPTNLPNQYPTCEPPNHAVQPQPVHLRLPLPLELPLPLHQPFLLPFSFTVQLFCGNP